MHSTLSISLSASTTEQVQERGAVKVGWMADIDKGSLLYGPPKRVAIRPPNKTHAKSASRCPAVLQMESRYFEVPCPVDIHIGFERDPKTGKAVLVNKAGPSSPVRSNKLGELLVLVAENEWRFPDRPTLQLKLPYIFMSDEPVWMTQLDAFGHYRKHRLPGTIFGGRFPIHIWPRPMMWAMEWQDTKADLKLERGEPLFYVQFESLNPERPIALVEAEKTAELTEYLNAISGVVNYVNQTFSLFDEAMTIRPPKLLSPKERQRETPAAGCPFPHE